MLLLCACAAVDNFALKCSDARWLCTRNVLICTNSARFHVNFAEATVGIASMTPSTTRTTVSFVFSGLPSSVTQRAILEHGMPGKRAFTNPLRAHPEIRRVISAVGGRICSAANGSASGAGDRCRRGGRAQRRSERLFEDVERLVDLLVGRHQGDQYAQALAVDASLENHQPALHRALGNGCRQLWRRLLGGGILDELERQHRAQPAHVAQL